MYSSALRCIWFFIVTVAISAAQLNVSVLLFDGFEDLDAFGPIELFSCSKQIRITTCAYSTALPPAVRAGSGARVLADATLAECPIGDLLHIPGGMATRKLVDDEHFISEVARLAAAHDHLFTVCTGAALLARTGLLDGKRATTNKKAWDWATSQGSDVNWVCQARWVTDGNSTTSSGVSSGLDGALAVVERLLGPDVALSASTNAEYEWERDPSRDPFCQPCGCGQVSV